MKDINDLINFGLTIIQWWGLIALGIAFILSVIVGLKKDNRCNERKNFLGKWHICGVRHGATLRTWYCEKHKNRGVRK